MAKITLNDGKYTVVNELNEGGGLHALRYGEEWRNLAGDNLTLAMYHEIERLRDGLLYLTNSISFDSPDQMSEVAQAYLDGREDE